MRPMRCWMDGMRWWMGPHRARGANSIEMRDRENAREGGHIHDSTNRGRESGVPDREILFFGEKNSKIKGDSYKAGHSNEQDDIKWVQY